MIARVGSLVLCSVATAQLAPPGAHWGTSVYPVSHPEERITFQFHRFSEKSSSGSVHPSGITDTTGFNLATLSVTREMIAGLHARAGRGPAQRDRVPRWRRRQLPVC